MAQILVSGLVNLETTVQVESFPIEYTPVKYPFFGVTSTISGVGFNVAKALTVLGDHVHLLSILGRDQAGKLAKEMVKSEGIDTRYLDRSIKQTAQSAVLFDFEGRRQINVDLKDIQDASYSIKLFDDAVPGSQLAVLCNINYSRPLLKLAHLAHIPVATDVHTIADIKDEYNRDFMASANILFMSDEKLPCPPEEWAERVLNRYGNEIIVIGLGAQGAVLSVRGDRFIERIAASSAPMVKNSIGAGDALFSSFLHYYLKDGNPYRALEKAQVFAAYKIGFVGASDGFLSEAEVEEAYNKKT